MIYTQGQMLGQWFPVGSIVAWCNSTLPEGWLLCDGSELSYTSESGKYKPLYDVIQNMYGEGSTGGSFKLPDLRDRFIEGASTTHPVGTYTEALLPEHSHTFVGSSVTSTTAGSHSHTRGTLNVTGSWSANFANVSGKWIDLFWTSAEGSISAPSATTSTNASGNPSYSSRSIPGQLNLKASDSWSGSLAYSGNHSHTFTAKGTIGNASANQSVYGKSNTVQPKSLMLNYIIKY